LGRNLKTALKELISKVLENSKIENYLEGISKSSKLEFPKLEKEVNLNINEKHTDISGTWIGAFRIEVKHDIILEISQKENDLFATAVITFDINNNHSVVQQNMNGSIQDDKITLVGVNYTFVRRGNANNYNMDSFQLTFNKSDKSLSGFVLDEKDETSKISLKRKRNL